MLAQTKHLLRYNAALKILFFEMLRDRGLGAIHSSELDRSISDRSNLDRS